MKIIYMKGNTIHQRAIDEMSNAELKNAHSQKSLILKYLLAGTEVNRFAVMRQPIGCAKICTRISEIRASLLNYGVQVKDNETISLRGGKCKSYYVDQCDIDRLKRILK